MIIPVLVCSLRRHARVRAVVGGLASARIYSAEFTWRRHPVGFVEPQSGGRPVPVGGYFAHKH